MRGAITILALAGVLAMGGDASAQAASQRGSVTQTIGEHTLVVDYSRPIIRGRTIFGDHLNWGYVWTPGANDATTFEIDTDVTVNGNEVPAGKYSLWMELLEDEPWQVILDPNDSLFHTQKPQPDGEGQIRFMVEPGWGPHEEVLSFSVPDLGPTHAVVELSWENVRIPLRVEVPVEYALTVDPEEALGFVGSYEMRFTEEVLEERGRPDEPTTVRIWLEGDELHFHAANWPEPYGQILLPRAHGVFRQGMTINKVFASPQESFVEFVYDGDEVTGFQVRNGEDRLMRTAERVDEGG